MALSQSFKATSTQAIKLAEMNAVPNTEDLRYMLSECTTQRKPVILPFKNPNNGLGFVVKVSPAIGDGGPRWTFERVSGNAPSTMWTRETREVAMIQGKLAIDTIYVPASENTGSNSVSENNTDGETNNNVSSFSPRHSGSYPVISTASQDILPVGHNLAHAGHNLAHAGHDLAQTGAFPAVSRQSKATQEIDLSETPTVETPVVSPPPFAFIEPPNYGNESSNNWFCSFNSYQPETSTLPPPAQFDAKLLGQVVSSLTDPNTYLATYGAFSYFLLRQFAQYQMTQAGFAVVVFEISIKQNGVEMQLPQEAFRTIAERISPLMSPLDVAAHVGGGEFVILLCSSDSADAFRFARSLYGTLCGQSILPSGTKADEAFVIGAAALPESCKDPGELLAAAREAKEAAFQTSRPYLLYQ